MIHRLGYEVAHEMHYVLTEADVWDGKNKLGIDVSHIPLNVALCEGCDTPIPSDGCCDRCMVWHGDIAVQTTEMRGDPPLRKDAA